MTKLLEVRNLALSLRSGESPLFEVQSFELESGERLSLMGPSGTGKTLFLRSICMLEPHATGDIKWKGTTISNNQIPQYRSRVIYVGQRSALSYGTARSSIEEVFKYKVHRGRVWNAESTRNALIQLGKGDRFLDKTVDHLSGGEKQILNILKAVALQPEVICFDEPTSALDFDSTLKMENWLKANYHGSWIWVTHQSDQAKRLGKRIKFQSLYQREDQYSSCSQQARRHY